MPRLVSFTSSVTCRNLVLKMLQSKLVLQTNPALIASSQHLALGKMSKQLMRKGPQSQAEHRSSSSPVPARPGVSCRINRRQIS